MDDFEAELERVNAQLDTLTDELEMPAVEPPPFDITDLGPLEDDEDFDFLSGTNETATKLDLARATSTWVTARALATSLMRC